MYYLSIHLAHTEKSERGDGVREGQIDTKMEEEGWRREGKKEEEGWKREGGRLEMEGSWGRGGMEEGHMEGGSEGERKRGREMEHVNGCTD